MVRSAHLEGVQGGGGGGGGGGGKGGGGVRGSDTSHCL